MCRTAGFWEWSVGYSGELEYYNRSLSHQANINKKAALFSYADLVDSSMSLEQMIYSVNLAQVPDQ